MTGFLGGGFKWMRRGAEQPATSVEATTDAEAPGSPGQDHAGALPSSAVKVRSGAAPLPQIPGLGKVLEEVRQLKQAHQFEPAAELLARTYRAQEHPVVGYRLIATLLDLQRYDEILTFPTARRYNSRDYAVAEQLVRASRTEIPQLHLDGDPAIAERVGFVTMVKDEQDIILFNLVWHYALGVRRFFLLDNQSTDATDALVRLFEARFPEATLLVLRDTVVAHLQGRKVSGACSYIKSLWPELEWVLLVDADEFICVDRPLGTLLSSAVEGSDAIVLPKSVYRPRPGDDLHGAAPFFERLQHRQPLSHVSTKMIVRSGVGLDIAQGNHRFFEPQGYTTSSYSAVAGLTMREYPIRSMDQFERKVVSGSRAVMAARDVGLQAVGGDHWVGMNKLFEQQGRQGLEAKLAGQSAAHAKRGLVHDPLPLPAVMDRHLPDWRGLLQDALLTAGRRTDP